MWNVVILLMCWWWINHCCHFSSFSKRIPLPNVTSQSLSWLFLLLGKSNNASLCAFSSFLISQFVGFCCRQIMELMASVFLPLVPGPTPRHGACQLPALLSEHKIYRNHLPICSFIFHGLILDPGVSRSSSAVELSVSRRNHSPHFCPLYLI